MSLSKFREVSICQVCYDPFEVQGNKIPKLLDCGHSFCLDDCSQLHKDGAISCPLDRSFTRGPLANLKTNFTVVDLITEMHQASDSAESVSGRQAVCEGCDQPSVIDTYCPKCEIDVCSKCAGLTFHQKHGVVPLKQKAKAIKPKCKEHDDMPLNLYCEQCKVVCCLMCMNVGDHKGHPVIPTKQASQNSKKDLRIIGAAVAELNSRIVADLRATSTNKQESERLLFGIEANIKNHFQAVVQAAKAREQVLLKELRTTQEDEMLQFDFQTKQLALLSSEVSFVTDRISSLDKESDEVTLLSDVPRLDLMLQSLKKQQSAFGEPQPPSQISFVCTNISGQVSALGQLKCLKAEAQRKAAEEKARQAEAERKAAEEKARQAQRLAILDDAIAQRPAQRIPPNAQRIYPYDV